MRKVQIRSPLSRSQEVRGNQLSSASFWLKRQMKSLVQLSKLMARVWSLAAGLWGLKSTIDLSFLAPVAGASAVCELFCWNSFCWAQDVTSPEDFNNNQDLPGKNKSIFVGTSRCKWVKDACCSICPIVLRIFDLFWWSSSWWDQCRPALQHAGDPLKCADVIY